MYDVVKNKRLSAKVKSAEVRKWKVGKRGFILRSSSFAALRRMDATENGRAETQKCKSQKRKSSIVRRVFPVPLPFFFPPLQISLSFRIRRQTPVRYGLCLASSLIWPLRFEGCRLFRYLLSECPSIF